ncbi:MAG: hypothetical protein IT304_09495 [Dehalococcoidia bacterium]|nr:hypothetical protein [Dehalococcoidia bacterium]
MYARVTQFDVDTVAISVEAALLRFKDLVLPELRRQPGYEGALLLRTPEGKGLLLTYWSSESAARATVESGFYAAQIGKFLTFYRQPPGREHYEVVLRDLPAATIPTPGGTEGPG